MNLKTLFGMTVVMIMMFSCNQKKECCKKGAETKGTESSMDESIYNIHSEWIKQDGTKMNLDALKGKIVIAAMVFTHCESACPRIVSDIQRIEKDVTNVSNVHFLLISMDPARDTPERFREFAKERQLGTNWTMVSSSQETTDEIANVLGVKIKKLSDGGFDHSNSIFVIDQAGNIVFIQEGLEQEPTETIKRIKELNP
jgi:protein SCO1/2